MSKSEGFVVLDTESNAAIGAKPNVEMEKKASYGNTTRKKLADISNLPKQARVSTLDEKSCLMPIVSKEYVDQLKKENLALMNILTERNALNSKIIDVTGIELQKMRVNLQKMQQQNLQLAQSNSQMLADLNSSKDKLKALQHELGCKNGLLKAKKLEMEERLKTKKCEKFDDEVELTNCEAAEVNGSFKVGRDEDNCGNTQRRLKSKSLGPRQVQSKDETENKRPCVRRQSARFKAEVIKPPSDLLETEDTKVSVCFPSIKDDPLCESGSTCACVSVQDEGREGKRASRHEAGNKSPCVKRQSARFKAEVIKPPSDLLETEDTKVSVCFPSIEDDPLCKSGSTSACVSVQDEGREGRRASRHEAGNTRPCVRRQSARFKGEVIKPPADLLETEDTKVSVCFPSIEDDPLCESGSTSACVSVQGGGREGKRASRHKAGNKRSCVRRQSARFKSEEPKPSEDLFHTEDAKFSVSVLKDGALLEDVSTSTGLVLKNEGHDGNLAAAFETQESKRSSLSRPLRQAAKKVQSYKEIALNIKMRRPE